MGMAPPLVYIRRGRPPFFRHTRLSFFLLLLPGSGLPCLEAAPGLEFSNIWQAVVLLEPGSVAVFLPLLAWFGAREEHRLYRTCIISSRHYRSEEHTSEL